MIWGAVKHALNSTLLTAGFKPLDQMIVERTFPIHTKTPVMTTGAVLNVPQGITTVLSLTGDRVILGGHISFVARNTVNRTLRVWVDGVSLMEISLEYHDKRYYTYSNFTTFNKGPVVPQATPDPTEGDLVNTIPLPYGLHFNSSFSVTCVNTGDSTRRFDLWTAVYSVPA